MGNAEMVFDSLKYSKELQEVGLTSEQAEVHASTLLRLVSDQCVTKSDINSLQDKTEAFWQEMQSSDEKLSYKIDASVELLRQEVQSSNETLNRKIDASVELLRQEVQSSDEKLNRKIDASVELLRQELQSSDETLNRKIDASVELLRQETKTLRQEVQSSDEKLNRKIDASVELLRQEARAMEQRLGHRIDAMQSVLFLRLGGAIFASTTILGAMIKFIH